MAISINGNDLNTPQSLSTITPTPDPILSTGQGIVDRALSSIQSTQASVDANTANTSSTVSRIDDLMKSLLPKTQDTATYNQTYGVNNERANLDKYNQQLNDINASVSGLGREAQAIPLRIQQQFANSGATDAGVAPIQAGQLRENAIKALTQAALADITTANINNSTIRYNSAKEKVAEAIDLKYKPIETEISQLKEQLALNKQYITDPAEKKLAQEQELALAERQRLLNDKKETDKTITSLKLEIAKNGGDPSVLDGASTISEAINKGASALRTPNNEIVKLGDNQAYLIDKNTGKIIRSFGGGSGTGTGATGGVQLTPQQTALYTPLINTILASGKFTKDQAASLKLALTTGQDPFIVVKNQAKNIMGQTEATKLTALESSRDTFNDLGTALKAYYDAGGDTSLIRGKMENISNRLGFVRDPKLVELAVQLQGSIQAYRNAISGTAYSNQEGKDINTIFPGINKSQTLNDAISRGRTKLFDSSIDAIYRSTIGNTYDKLKELDGAGTKGGMEDSQFIQTALNKQGITYESVINDGANFPGKIPVVDNSTGQIGFILPNEYNSSKFTKI